MLPVTSMQKTMSTAYFRPLAATGAWPGTAGSAGEPVSCSVMCKLPELVSSTTGRGLGPAVGDERFWVSRDGPGQTGDPRCGPCRRGEHSRGLPPPLQGVNVLGLIISAIVVGLIIGALGRLVLPGRQDMPIWLTIVIGIVAALIGSLIASALGVGDTNGIDWIKLIIQVALAALGVSLVAGRYATGRRRL